MRRHFRGKVYALDLVIPTRQRGLSYPPKSNTVRNTFLKRYWECSKSRRDDEGASKCMPAKVTTMACNITRVFSSEAAKVARRNGADDARGLRKMRGLSRVRVVMVFSAQRAVTTAAYRQLGALGDICNIVGI